MTIPVYRRFSVQDYPDSPEYLAQLFVPLNMFCEQTVQALTRNLEIGLNVQGQKYTMSFVTSSTYAAGDFTPIKVNYNGVNTPNMCIIGRISDQSGAKILTPVSISDWFLNTNKQPFEVTINYVAGLAANSRYTMNFIVF